MHSAPPSILLSLNYDQEHQGIFMINRLQVSNEGFVRIQ